MRHTDSRTVRVATAADAREIAALLDRFNREFDSPTPGAAVLAPRVIEHIERDLSVFLLAEAREVGVAQLRFRDYLFLGASICTLEELYVVPESRGQGLGRALLNASMQVARARAAVSIELNTSTDDRPARGLYESAGFTNLERPGDLESAILYYERDL